MTIWRNQGIWVILVDLELKSWSIPNILTIFIQSALGKPWGVNAGDPHSLLPVTHLQPRALNHRVVKSPMTSHFPRSVWQEGLQGVTGCFGSPVTNIFGWTARIFFINDEFHAISPREIILRFSSQTRVTSSSLSDFLLYLNNILEKNHMNHSRWVSTSLFLVLNFTLAKSDSWRFATIKIHILPV